MLNPQPSDATPEYPSTRHEQIRLLRRMFGAAEPSADTPPSGPRPWFRPMTGTLTMTERDGLAWTPGMLHEPPADADSPDVLVLIDHYLLALPRRGRTAAKVAVIRADVERYASRIGAYTLSLDAPPHAWTVETIRGLVDRVLPLVPNDDPAARREDAAVDVVLGAFAESCGSISQITITPAGTGGFYAQIAVHAAAAPAVAAWVRLFGQGESAWTTVRAIDAVVPKAAGAAGAEAARRALPAASRAPVSTADTRRGDLRRIGAAITRLTPDALRLLADVAEAFVERVRRS